MPTYRIYRLRESRRKHFRWAPHTSGATSVAPRDYSGEEATEAPTPYALWSRMREGDQPLHVGDVLENAEGELRICKYVGFEEAQWMLPEVATGVEAAPAAVERTGI